MDIIDVTQSHLKASLEEATFDINATLQQPAEQGARERFTKALRKYSHTMLQLETLFRLKEELEQSDQQPELEQSDQQPETASGTKEE